LERHTIESLIDKGIRSFEKSLAKRFVDDIENFFDTTPDVKRNLRGMVVALYALKQKYGREFDVYITEWLENPTTPDLHEAKFAEASTAFIPMVFASETLEQLHKDHWFDELYERNMYYPNIFLYMEYVQTMLIQPGYYLRFYTESQDNSKTVYLFVDEEASFGEIIERALKYMPSVIHFGCDLVPLDYIPAEDEDFVYVRMSDVPTIELFSQPKAA
jgi:hypothetical protein